MFLIHATCCNYAEYRDISVVTGYKGEHEDINIIVMRAARYNHVHRVVKAMTAIYFMYLSDLSKTGGGSKPAQGCFPDYKNMYKNKTTTDTQNYYRYTKLQIC